MAELVLNTLSIARRLENAGFSREQAEAQASIFTELIDGSIATRRDLRELELRLKYDLTLRFGAMLCAATGILAALITLVR